MNQVAESLNFTSKNSLINVLEEFPLIEKNIRRWNFYYHIATPILLHSILLYLNEYLQYLFTKFELQTK